MFPREAVLESVEFHCIFSTWSGQPTIRANFNVFSAFPPTTSSILLVKVDSFTTLPFSAVA